MPAVHGNGECHQPGNGPRTLQSESLAEEPGPIGVQLFDHRPQAMADAAKRAEANGAFLIDINMGCPVRKIARKGGGSGLIRDPELATRIVEAVASAVALPVTVKTRLGWCGSDADPVDWCQQLERAGAQLLTLHGRTREQGFKGAADWNAISQVRQALAIPLIANGDINTPEDALRCLDQTGAAGVMVGRGTMGAPWLVGQSTPHWPVVPSPPRHPVSGSRWPSNWMLWCRIAATMGADRPKTHGLDLHRLSGSIATAS